MCKEHGMPYALWVNRTSQLLLDYFVSHGWAENLVRFGKAIDDYLKQIYSTQKNLWICALALLQSDDPQVIAQQVSTTNVSEAPFAIALKEAKVFLVVRNLEIDI